MRRKADCMKMNHVVSSDLESVGYEDGTLYIRFHSGGTYRYSGVPVSVYRGLMSAASHGKYFHANVKGLYPYARIA